MTAAALHYDDPDVLGIARVTPEQGRNPLTSEHVIRMVDGTGRRISSEKHPDPRVEVLRWARCDAEVIQALHRVRVFDRTEANRVELHVFGQVDTELPVHQLRRVLDGRREEAEVAIANGALFERGESFRAAHPELHLTESSARRVAATAWQNFESLVEGFRRQSLSIDTSVWQMAQFRTVDPSKRGGRGYTEQVQLDARRYPDPLSAVQALLGRDVSDCEWIRASSIEQGLDTSGGATA